MVLQTQIKNIGDSRRELLFKQFALKKQLREVEKELKLLDDRENEMWVSRFEEQEINEPKQEDDEHDDALDEMCQLRTRMKKTKNKGLNRRSVHRKGYMFWGNDKQRAKEARSKKKKESFRHQKETRGEGEDAIMAAEEESEFFDWYDYDDQSDESDDLPPHYRGIRDVCNTCHRYDCVCSDCSSEASSPLWYSDEREHEAYYHDSAHQSAVSSPLWYSDEREHEAYHTEFAW